MSPSLIALALALGAEPLAADQAAQIEFEQQQAQAEVSARYGNRKLSELSQDERRQLTRDRAEAEAKVLSKHGVDARQWARESLKRDRAAYADGQQRVKALADKARAEAEAAAKAPPGGGDVVVQRGFSDDKPVVLEEKQGAAPILEQGIPRDVAEDEAAAAEQDRLEAGAPAEGARGPAAKGKGGRQP